jgi:hypothetical protein
MTSYIFLQNLYDPIKLKDRLSPQLNLYFFLFQLFFFLLNLLLESVRVIKLDSFLSLFDFLSIEFFHPCITKLLELIHAQLLQLL